MLSRAIDSAFPCDDVWVSTDDDVIAAVAAREGARVIMRPPQLCRDSSSTESCVAHWYRSLRSGERPDVIALLQPTSPLRTDVHVLEAIALLEDTGASSLVSVSVEPRHHFACRLYPRDDGARDVRPFRPWSYRPRTQDVHALGVENGAIWLFTREHWETHGRRDGGARCIAYEMSPLESVDVDTAEDLELAEACALVLRRRASAVVM